MNTADWRTWLYDRLRTAVLVTDLVPEASIYGAGSITGPPPAKPFIVIRMEDDVPEFPGCSRQGATLFFHDDPGTYNRLDDIRRAVRHALCGPDDHIGAVVQSGAIACRWIADGADSSDEGYGTLTKSTEYQLIGRSGNG